MHTFTTLLLASLLWACSIQGSLGDTKNYIALSPRQLRPLTGSPIIDKTGTMLVKVAEANPPNTKGVDIFFRVHNDGQTAQRLRARQESGAGGAGGEGGGTTATTSLRSGAVGVEVSISIMEGGEGEVEPPVEGGGEGEAPAGEGEPAATEEGAAGEGEVAMKGK